jgi:GH24 family phage-related lysozyme (muramidase)
MSSYLISHNHSLYVLLTGTRKIMDIKELVMQSAEYPQRFLSDGELGKLSDFIKEQEGTTEYQQVRGYYDPESQTFKARQDDKGIWTIGYGSTITSGIKVKKGDTISLSEAEDLLRHTIKEKTAQTNIEFINKYGKGLHDLSSDSKLLAIDMAYQLGPSELTNKSATLVPAFFEDDWATIEKEYIIEDAPEINVDRKLMFIQNNLDRINYFNNKSKEWEQEDNQELASADTNLNTSIQEPESSSHNIESDTDKVDWKFISEREGEAIKKGYVVEDNEGIPYPKSGVTIGTGVDLGSKTRKFFENIGVPDHIIEVLEPYFGLKGDEAKAFLEKKPFELSPVDIKILDKAVQKFEFNRIKTAYEKDSNKSWNSLSANQQTVVTSVGFQHGDLKTKARNFWNQVLNDKWDDAIANLRDWDETGKPSKFQKRRDLEAELLTSDKFKQFEEKRKKESLKIQKKVYDTMPDLLNAIQTQQIPKEKMKDFVTKAASGKLLSEIGERIHVPEFIENLGIDVDVKGKDKFAITGKGITYKQKPGEQSVSAKGFTYTQTDEQKRLEKKFGKKGDITGSIGISKSDVGDEKTIGGQINIPIHKIFKRRRKRR